jgi:ribose transport system ATP-binding protein
MSNISKSWGTLKALSQVELIAHKGEVHALMGENGAGKSTLINILSGLFKPDMGAEITLDGSLVSMSSPRDAKSLGISTIHQELALAENLTASENLFLGNEIRQNRLLSRSHMRVQARKILNELSAPFQPDTIVGTLSLAHRQMVEIGKALLAKSRILVMDEPTTSLSERETESLFGLIGQLKRDGMAIIYISHRMNEIYALSDRVTVLRDGKSIGTLNRAELDPDRLVRMMVGRDLSSFYHKEHRTDLSNAPVVLSVEDVADDRNVFGCSFDVSAGEVVGIAGLVGAGRTELARLIASIDERKRGAVRIGGAEHTAKDASSAMEAGLVYLTEDRKGLGLFLEMTVQDNININVASQDAGFLGILNRRAARARSQGAFERLRIKAANDQIAVGKLSGGNQQKALLARLLELKPKALLLDEPTRGVDIGAKIEIYKLIDELASAGVAVVVISSEMPELIGVCDRLIVMRDGVFVGEIQQNSEKRATQEEIMSMISAVEEGAAQ